MKPLASALSGIRRKPLAAISLPTAPTSAEMPSTLMPCDGILAGAQHFRRGLAFGKRHLLIDDQRTAQRHREQHAEQAAETGDRQHPPVLEVRPVAHEHQRRHREDHARGDRGAGRRAGLHDVVLEDAAAAERAQHRHRDHRGGNRRGDGHAGEQPEIGVGGGEDHREHDRRG